MVAMLSSDEYILTISKYGMAKRSRLGTAEKIHDTDAAGEHKFEDDGSPKMVTDGYRRTKPGAKGVRTMKLDEEHQDTIISVRTIPDIDDHLFLLTKSGMMIRIRVSDTKETSGKSTKGTRVMELRDKQKGGFIDESSSRPVFLHHFSMSTMKKKRAKHHLTSAKRNDAIPHLRNSAATQASDAFKRDADVFGPQGAFPPAVRLMDERSLIYDWNTVEYDFKRDANNHPHGVWFDDETLRDGLQSPSARNPTIEQKIELPRLHGATRFAKGRPRPARGWPVPPQPH